MVTAASRTIYGQEVEPPAHRQRFARGVPGGLVELWVAGRDPVFGVAGRDPNGAAATFGDHVEGGVRALLAGEAGDLVDVGIGERERVAGVLEVAALVREAQRDGVV